jgi:hypothetical protein
MHRMREFEPQRSDDLPRDGAVRIIDYGELAMPESHRIRLGSAARFQRRRAYAVGAFGLVLLVGAAMILAPSMKPADRSSKAGPSAAGSASPAPVVSDPASNAGTPKPRATGSLAWLQPTMPPLDDSGGWTVRIDPTPTPTNPWLPDPDPTFTADGWPVTIPDPGSLGDGILGPTGPDGTIYLDGAPALDSSGHVKAESLELPDGESFVPELFGSDGSAYGTTENATVGQTVWGFDPSGRLALHQPIVSYPAPVLAAGPDSTLYVVAFPPANQTMNPARPEVTIFDRAGRQVSSWTLPGWPVFADGRAALLVRDDGAILVSAAVEGGCGLYLLTPAGAEVWTDGSACWSSLVRGPDGTVVAMAYDAVTTSADQMVTGTTVAVLDGNGRPASGWPILIPGAASRPGFDGERGLYFDVYQRTSGQSQLWSLDLAGNVRQGWPIPLPGEPLWQIGALQLPSAPVVGDSKVFVSSSSSITAYSTGGRLLPGWPMRLPAGWDSGPCSSYQPQPRDRLPVYSEASGLLFVPLANRVVAYTASGQVAAGWPKVLTDADYQCWGSWRGTDGGGLLISEIGIDQTTGESYVRLFSWTAAGKLG